MRWALSCHMALYYCLSQDQRVSKVVAFTPLNSLIPVPGCCANGMWSPVGSVVCSVECSAWRCSPNQNNCKSMDYLTSSHSAPHILPILYTALFVCVVSLSYDRLCWMDTFSWHSFGVLEWTVDLAPPQMCTRALEPWTNIHVHVCACCQCIA